MKRHGNVRTASVWSAFCATCALPPLSDSFFAEDSIQESLITTVESEVSQSTQKNQERSDDTVTDNAQLESLRKHVNKDILMCHLNINSIQNKFEELAATIKKIGAHIAFISETKIDASYPDAQFLATHCIETTGKREAEVLWHWCHLL